MAGWEWTPERRKEATERWWRMWEAWLAPIRERAKK